ncbi:MAG: hypothetical protein LJE57_01610 [Gallionella sp.]|nr:hypothetical protein [Gallionella sp.]
MEFFATTIIPASAEDLQRRLTIGELPQWCASIEKVLSDAESSGEIYCVWGTFHTNREDMRNGVRFSLPGCPNAFQWTVTTGHQPNPQHTYIHATINRTDQDQDFVDSLQKFVDDWKAGLETHW